MIRFLGLTLVSVALLTLVTIFLMKVIKNKFIAKTMPTIMMWLVSLLLFLYAILFAEPMQDLGYLVMAMILGTSSLVTLVIIIVIDNINKRKVRK
jgi:drug/metabolite transporter (DMT)-like permease